MQHSQSNRQMQIVDFLNKNHFVDISFLTSRFKVSVATIRRDLNELEKKGLLRRTHGGAIGVNQVMQDPVYATRKISNLPEKIAIAATSEQMIQEGDVVLLDAGTTTLELAKRLKGRNDLTLISNGIDIVNELINGNTDKVFSVGGEFSVANRSFRGPLAEQFINQFSVDKLFLNAASLDLKRGLIFTTCPANASVQKNMIEIANHVVVLADHSKFLKMNMSVVTKIDAIGAVVTDRRAIKIIESLPEKSRSKFIIST